MQEGHIGHMTAVATVSMAGSLEKKHDSKTEWIHLRFNISFIFLTAVGGTGTDPNIWRLTAICIYTCDQITNQLWMLKKTTEIYINTVAKIQTKGPLCGNIHI